MWIFWIGLLLINKARPSPYVLMSFSSRYTFSASDKLYWAVFNVLPRAWPSRHQCSYLNIMPTFKMIRCNLWYITLRVQNTTVSPAACLENREGGARARRAPLHPRRAPYGRHWRAFSEGLFVVGRAPEGAIRRPDSPWAAFKTRSNLPIL